MAQPVDARLVATLTSDHGPGAPFDPVLRTIGLYVCGQGWYFASVGDAAAIQWRSVAAVCEWLSRHSAEVLVVDVEALTGLGVGEYVPQAGTRLHQVCRDVVEHLKAAEAPVVWMSMNGKTLLVGVGDQFEDVARRVSCG